MSLGQQNWAQLRRAASEADTGRSLTSSTLSLLQGSLSDVQSSLALNDMCTYMYTWEAPMSKAPERLTSPALMDALQRL